MSEGTAEDTRVRINKPKWLRVKLPTGENYKRKPLSIVWHVLEIQKCCKQGDSGYHEVNPKRYYFDEFIN